MRKGALRSLICVSLAAAVTVSGCRPPAAPAPARPLPVAAPVRAPSTPGGEAPAGRPEVPIVPAEGGLVTADVPEPDPASRTAAVAPLPDAEASALLARLPPLPADPGPAPVLRPPSAAPPRAGAIQPIAFTIPTGKPVADAPVAPFPRPPAPLAPPQISPEGEIESESEVRIRFSEPMVPVAQVGTVASPPATIAPAIAGTWRWIDTRVLSFATSAARFPGASQIVVTVPAGARAVSGAALGEAVRASFTTRPVQITGVHPRTSRPDGPVAIGFDQRVDPARIAALLDVRRPDGAALPFRAIALADALPRWRANPSLDLDEARLAEELGPHVVVIAPGAAWPAGATAHVVLRPGAPSAEGPRVTTRATSASFQVVAPFTLRGVACGDDDRPRMAGRTCPANGRARLELSNRLLERSLRAGMFQLEGRPFDGRGTFSVGFAVPAGPARTLDVAIGEGLTDVYGQPLAGPRRAAFAIGPARHEPILQATSGLLVLDPRFEIPQWIVRAEAAAAVRIQLYQVQPEDYFAFAAFERGARATPPGRRILDRTHPVGARSGLELRTDLRPALGAAGLGHVVAIASLTAPPARRAADTSWRTAAWIQVTRLGVAARLDRERVHAWVQDVSPARLLAPRAGIEAAIVIEGRPGGARATTDGSGHAAFDLPPQVPPPPPPPRGAPRAPDPIALLVARDAGDATFVALHGGYERATRHHEAYWYATDDRFTYRPGERVHVKGWVRWTHDGVNPDLALPAPGEEVAYTLVDARDRQLASGRAPLSDHGGFDLTVKLPADANLGRARFTFTTRGAEHGHAISIQEFRSPAFAVTLTEDVTHGGARPLVVGERIEMSAAAAYYAGGGLPGARIAWHAELAPAWYAPPGWDGFRFAPPAGPDEPYRPPFTVATQGTLSAASAASIAYGVAAVPDGRPATLTVDAVVIDVDRARIRATSRPILVHPSSYYVGLQRRATAAGAPDAIDAIDAIVTDIDGNPVPGVEIDVAIAPAPAPGRPAAPAAAPVRCKLTSDAAPVACPFPREPGRAYTAIARIADARGRASAAELRVAGYEAHGSHELAVIADRAEYRPGDVAKLDIRSATVPATAVVTLARQGVISQRRVELTAPSTIVEIPIEPAHVPNLHVVIDRLAPVPPQPPGAPPLPGEESVELELPIARDGLRLAMRARPTRPLVEPGAPATFEVEVRRGGAPVAGAEVALMVVDEAVLALSSRSHADPLARFVRELEEGTWQASTLPLIEDAGDDLAGAPGLERYSLDTDGSRGFGTGGGRGGLRGRTAAVPSVSIGAGNLARMRLDFRPDAAFSPRLRTGPDGKARLTVDMPDNLTRYRVIALATADTRYFGKAESTIVAQRKINARTVAPRFLTQGDAFALPIVVQNLDARPRTVDVAVRAANLVATGPAGRRITIPAGQRAELRFDLATRARGRAVIQTIVRSGGAVDASSVELPVYEPATTEAFATYGVVDGDAPRFERLAVPADLFPEVGGVEVELASTELQALTDAYWYLYAYPYECAEQRSARMIATAALGGLLEAFAAPGRPARAEIDATIARDVHLLGREQHDDGGWGYFEGTRSDPFVTLQVLTALAAHQVTGGSARRAIAFAERQAAALLAGLERDARTGPANRPDRGELAYRIGLAAHALAALGATRIDVRARAERLHAAATALAVYPVDAKARLLALVARLPRAAAMRARLLAELGAATRETASSAAVAARFEERERRLLGSSTRTTALVLDALLREAPDHPLVTKLVRGVLDARRAGRWGSTQENLVALTALRRYFDRHEKEVPAFTGRVWLGGAAYAERAFAGRDGARGAAHAGWAQLSPGTAHDVAIAKAGAGRLYYRVGITYAPRQPDLPALDAGFVVRRTYAAIDDPGDVARLPGGRWKIRLGARVQVTVEALAPAARHGVAIVDPLPAGLEAVNDALATSERAVRGPGGAAWDHVALRDNRSEAFAMELAPGRHQLSYTARAATPGTFLAAPAKAEEMYSPETFGRSIGSTVVIE